MGIKIAFVKSKLMGLPVFMPATPLDEEEFAKLKSDGEVYQAEFKAMRNWKFHRKFFAMIAVAMENMDDDVKQRHNVSTTDAFLINLKIRLGHYDHSIIDDKVVYTPRSISFASMDQHEFKEFYQNTLNVIYAHFLPGDQRMLENAVVRMIGFDV